MATPFNQGVSATPVFLNSSNVFVFGNTASGSALNVRQFGTGNCLTVSNASGAVGLTVSGTGAVGIGGVVPSSLTDTFTISGNTSFVGNVTVTTDASSNNYVLAKRTPAGSLGVQNYVTGSVPLTTTTSLINNYLSNAASISAAGVANYGPTLSLAGTTNSGVIWQTGHSANFSNLALSNIFIEAWIYRTSSAAGVIFERALGAGADILLYVSSGSPGTLTGIVNNTGGTAAASAASSITIGLNGWVHVAMSYNRTSATAGTLYCFTNGQGQGTGGIASTQPRLQPTANIYLGFDAGGTNFQGHIGDVRVMTGCVVPTTATFSAQAAPFTTAPTYRAGMDTGYSSNLTMSLNSQYFPGASTPPYGPCLTLPGTAGSYYTEVNSAQNVNWKSNGFCCEMWVNYASFASANGYYLTSSSPYSMGLYFPVAAAEYDWGFGALSGGQVGLYWINSTSPYSLNTAPATLTTGTWNHIMVQSNGSNAYIAVNGTFLQLNGYGYTPAGNGTIAPNVSSVVTVNSGVPITVGAFGGQVGPNFAIAKARLVFGTTGSPSLGNVYSTGNFTPSPNFAPVPAGATLAWQLDSQFPLPTYPSIQDVTQLPPQSTSYGSLPTPVGGVTSNVLGPYATTYPQLDSVRFDGTGYIDYGNAASSALTTNLWANAWTIEGWVYLNALPGGALYPPIISRFGIGSTGVDWAFQISPTGVLFFQTPAQQIGGPTLTVGTWYHVAATYDGARCNVYTSFNSSSVGTATVTGADMTYVPSRNLIVGAYPSPTSYYITGNLADVRVSNVARYTGSSYTVPSAPFATDTNTILLLKSLAGQTGTTLAVQGRGTQSVSLGAGRTVNAYPPAPMSSYLLDTTSNASVTYGQGKYIASASSEYDTSGTFTAWKAFRGSGLWLSAANYVTSSPYSYTGSVSTTDAFGNSYAGEWLQIQMPVSVILTSYYFSAGIASKWWVLGSRDGINWTLVDSQNSTSILGTGYNSATVQVRTTQAYNYYRMVFNQGAAGSSFVQINAGLLFYGTEEGFCISSDSKTGVGIANPQRALEVAGDLVVSGTISGGAGMGAFRNRIINGDMRIAQRGTTSTTAGYLVDRWFVGFPTGGFTQSQVTLIPSDTPWQLGLKYATNVAITSSATNSYIRQAIENVNITDLNWGTSCGVPITVSFWYKTNATPGSIITMAIRTALWIGGVSWYVYPFTSVAIGQNTWQYVSVTIPPLPNLGYNLGMANNGGQDTLELFIASNYVAAAPVGTWTNTSAPGSPVPTTVWNTPGNYVTFTGVQLEKGTVATPFEFRPYATELALCQRYYQKTFSQGSYAGQNVNGAGAIYTIANGTTEVLGSRFVTTMRAIPVVTMYNPYTTTTTGVIGVGSSGADTAAATAATIGDSGFRLVSSSGLTGGLVYQYHYTASAEL